MSVDYTCNKNNKERPNLYYPIINPNTNEEIWPKETAVWRFSQERHQENILNDLVYWRKNGTNRVPRFRNFKTVGVDEIVPTTIWLHQDVGNTQEAKKEVTVLDESSPFATPKPERLIKRILDVASISGDLVLDSFLGSGTTAAVAHKMGRRHIGIEMGDHARTHCIPRLQKVIEGEHGGISQAVNWQGGGGFRFCTLGEVAFDEHGRINSAVRFATLAAYVWHFETGEPGQQAFDRPLLGIHNGTAYYLLYNGILGDRKPSSGNVLTHAVLQAINDIFPYIGRKVIYGETTRLGAARLAMENITFKQIPYDVKMR
jgi:adenine-specific DNA-methyltransferase